MKKHILVIIGTVLFMSTIKAQSFHKGAIVIDLGAGLNISKTTIEEEYNSQIWTGSGLTTVRIQKDTNDAVASVVYPLVVEYGVKNWLGVAGRVAFSKYFTGNDSANGVKTDVRGIDAGLIFNLHLIKTKRFDMPIGLTLGYSNFKMTSNDALQSQAKDNGINYGFAAVPRIYFGPGKHIGLSFNLGYMIYTYPNLLFSNKNDSNVNDNNDHEFKLKATGANIGIGLLIKI
jgi:hypothetical protein